MVIVIVVVVVVVKVKVKVGVVWCVTVCVCVCACVYLIWQGLSSVYRTLIHIMDIKYIIYILRSALTEISFFLAQLICRFVNSNERWIMELGRWTRWTRERYIPDPKPNPHNLEPKPKSKSKRDRSACEV